MKKVQVKKDACDKVIDGEKISEFEFAEYLAEELFATPMGGEMTEEKSPNKEATYVCYEAIVTDVELTNGQKFRVMVTELKPNK